MMGLVAVAGPLAPALAQQDPPASHAAGEQPPAAPPQVAPPDVASQAAPQVAPQAAPPASAPQTVAAPAKSAIVTANVNLRAGPGTDSEVIATIPGGSRVRVASCSGEWCAVTWNGREGYAIARNLDTTGRRVVRRYRPEPYYEGEPQAVYAEPPVYYAPPVVYGPGYYYYGPRYYYGSRWGYRWRRW